MANIKLTTEQFNQLCCMGSVHFNEYYLCSINTLTYLQKIAVMVTIRNNEKSLVQVVVE